MKLLIYELKKVLNKRIFLVVVALCLVINGFLLYSSQNTEENNLRLTYSDEYGEMLDEYSSIPLDKAKKQVEDELLAYEISGRLESLAQADNEELIESYTSELEEYRKSNPEAYQKAVEMSESREESFWKNSFLYDISQQIEYINSYPDFISEMYDRAKAQSASSIFGDENSFSYKNLYKTADDYSGLKDTKLNLVNSESFTATVKYGLTDFFVIAVVLLICIYLFGYERDKGLYSLIRCTKFGRLKTIIAKLAVLFVLSAVVSVLFILSDFIVNIFLYGSTDLSVNVQSISECRNCTLSVTAGQFLLLFALAKIIGIFVISSLLALVFIC
ncbi:MAG: ABC transporter permease, partial [Ruminococcus sp.]|nr:ABC transporter permease [Ruminococcus sp.]